MMPAEFFAVMAVVINGWAVIEAAQTFVKFRPAARISWRALRRYERPECMATINLGAAGIGVIWIVLGLVWLEAGTREGPAIAPMNTIGSLAGILHGFLSRSMRKIAQGEGWAQ